METAADSPVRADSSTLNDTASSTRASAGTSSPVSSSRMSPTTMSLFGTLRYSPSRITSKPVSSLTLFSMSNSLPARYSLTNAIVVAKKMATTIPIASRYSLRASPARKAMHAAMRRILMTGSSYFSRYSLHHGSRAGGVRVLAPCSLLLSRTSCEVKPMYCVITHLRSS